MNYEAVDKYGISLSASTLENSKFVQSLGKSWNQLTDNEKMMAAYNEITRQGASAQGLAKQEAQSFGMQAKLLFQRLKEVAGGIGEKLLPVLEPLIKKMVEAAENVASWVEKNPELTRTLLMITGGIGALLGVAGPLVMIVGTLIIAIGTFNAAMLPVIGTAALVALGITALVAAGIALWQNWDTLKLKVTELKDKMIESWNNAKDRIIEKASELKEKATKYISDKIENIKLKMSQLPGRIKEAWENAKQAMIQKAQEIISGAKQKITEKINGIKERAKGIKDKIKEAWDNAIQYLKGINLFKIGASIIKGMIKGITSMASSVVKSIKDTVQAGIDGAKKKLGINSPSRVFMALGKATGKGLIKGVESQKNDVKSSTSKLSKSAIEGYSIDSARTNINLGRSYEYAGNKINSIFASNNGKLQTEQPINININNPVINREADIEQIADELAFYIQRHKVAIGRW